MKKTISKLTLNRETLHRLDEAQIRGAVGNGPDQSLQYSRCDTCGIVCSVYTCNVELKQHVDNPGQTPM
jgi:hypothetical protein